MKISNLNHNDWNESGQNEAPKLVEPDKLMRMEMRRGGRKKASMTYNSYEDYLLIDKLKPDETEPEMVGVKVLLPDQERQIINDDASFWQKTHSSIEREMDLEQHKTEKREQMNMRTLEWMYNLPIDKQE